MANTTKDTLFKLIKSLNKSEKRYINLYLSKHLQEENSTSKILFDYLLKCVEYNENDLFVKFKNHALINKFSITKKRLYDQILSGLENFHNSKNIESQLFKQLSVVDVLINKSLYDQCEKILKSIEKIAIKHGQTVLLLYISEKRKRVLENIGNISESDLKIIESNDIKLNDSLKIKNKLFIVKSKLISLINKYGRNRNDELVFNFSKSLLFVNDVLSKYRDRNLINNEILFLCYHILSAYHFALNDLTKSKFFLEKNLFIFNKNNNLKSKNLYQYLSILNNLSFIYSQENHYEKLLEINKKLDEINSFSIIQNNDDLQLKCFISKASINMSILTMFEKKAINFDTVLDIEKGIELNYEKITPQRKAYLYLKISIFYFQNERIRDSLKYIHKIFQNKEFDSFYEIIDIAQLLHLFVLTEINDYNWFETALKKAQKEIKIKNDFIQLIIKSLSKINKTDNYFSKIELWQEFYSKINSLKDDEFIHIALEYFDFKSWIENKTKNFKQKLNNTVLF